MSNSFGVSARNRSVNGFEAKRDGAASTHSVDISRAYDVDVDRTDDGNGPTVGAANDDDASARRVACASARRINEWSIARRNHQSSASIVTTPRANCSRIARVMPPRTVKPKASPATAGATAAPSTPEGTSDINLRVLKRDDDAIESIVAHSKHAVLYRFDAAARQWARKNVEGALFVVSRSTAPKYAFVVLNRCGSENLTQAIGGDGFEVEPSVPYLMYKIGSEVNGIWFHDQSECESMTEVFEDLTAISRAAPPATSTSATVKHGLEALFASASSISPSSNHANGMNDIVSSSSASAAAPIRILQAPRNLAGASAARATTKVKSAPVAVASTPPAALPPAISPAAIKAALLELAADDVFTQRIARAISKHSA